LIYLDTSFLAPFYIHEATSDRVEDVLLAVPAGELAISDWTQVEFASLLTRRIRMGELTQEIVEETMRAFQADVAEFYVIFAVNTEDFERATQFLLQGNTGLRAGDALHLAIAYNREVENILSLDRDLIAAAQTLGISASSGGVYEN